MTAKRDELDKLGTELWNLTTRLRREEPRHNGKSQENEGQDSSLVCVLRAYAFFVLESASSQSVKGRERKPCIRLMKVALKAAKICILGHEVESAQRVLQSAASYEDILVNTGQHDRSCEVEVAKRLRLEYFAVRTALVGQPQPCFLKNT